MTTTTRGPYDFFLSHASPDKRSVDRYANHLQDLGASVAYDKFDITPGDDWLNRVFDLLRDSAICVVFLSARSTEALVQDKEVFLATYLSRQEPDRYRVVPVFLRGASTEHVFFGLQTVSGYMADRMTARTIARELMQLRAGLGDITTRTVRLTSMIDAVAMRWLYPERREPFHSRLELSGTAVQFVHGDFRGKRITREEFAEQLSPDDLRLIAHLEKKMELLFQHWEQNDLDSVASRDAESRADEFARRLGDEVEKVIDLLYRSEFELDDHYGHIQHVVADYYRRQR